VLSSLADLPNVSPNPLTDQHHTMGWHCPLCHDTSIAATMCERCDTDMVPDAGASPRTAHTRPWYDPELRWDLTLARRASPLRQLLDSLSILALLSFGPMLFGSYTWVVVLAAFAAMVALSYRRASQLNLLSDRTMPQRAVREVTEGPVRVQGATRALVTVSTKDGAPDCLAVQHTWSRGPGKLVATTAGGDFELDDGSGAPIVVRAEHALLPEGERSIPAGAWVEVLGHAQWCVGPEPGLGGGLRTSARRLEIVGTPEAPVFLKVVTPPARQGASPATETTGVRVGADPAVLHEDAAIPANSSQDRARHEG
jgi:hypothetical protein